MAYEQEPLKSDVLAIRVLTCIDHDIVPHDLPDDQVYKPIHHRIVSLSYVHAKIDRVNGGEQYQLLTVKPAGNPGQTEAQLLTAFWEFFNRKRPRIITFHGRNHLMPLLLQRSMIHGIQATGFFKADKWTGYTARFSPISHCDVEDQMTMNGAGKALSFDDACRAVGVPSRSRYLNSEETLEKIAMGQEEEVRGMADCDVLSVYLLYIRWMLLAGNMSVAQHDASVDSVVAHLTAQVSARPHLATYLATWRSSPRPNAMHVGLPPIAVAAE